MRKRWAGREVDLILLSKQVRRFIEDEGFETKKAKLRGEHRIVGVFRQPRGLPVKVSVRIFGSPNDFFVEFERGRRETRSRRILGSLLTLFGGGFLLSQDSRKEELLDKLERRLFVFLEEAVDHLTNSST